MTVNFAISVLQLIQEIYNEKLLNVWSGNFPDYITFFQLSEVIISLQVNILTFIEITGNDQLPLFFFTKQFIILRRFAESRLGKEGNMT